VAFCQADRRRCAHRHRIDPDPRAQWQPGGARGDRDWRRRLAPVEGRSDRVADRVRVDRDRSQREVERRRVGVLAPGQVIARGDAVEFQGQDLEWHAVSIRSESGWPGGIVRLRSAGPE
jgi:hypothetical protein